MAAATWLMKKRAVRRTATYEHEAGRLRRLADDKGVSFSYRKHALEEMAKDDIVRIDVENMLRRCKVTLVEETKGETAWRAEGKDTEGRSLTAVVVAYEDLIKVKIVTAWAKPVSVKRRRP
jgi:hypothetical protein